jgi:hypothetical protein
MKHVILLSLLCSGITTQAQNNFNYLDINKVKAGINSQGILHCAPSGYNPSYEVPKGGSKHSSAFTNLWFGGMHNNQLHLSAQLLPSGADFNSGPLSVDGSCLVTNSAKYTKIWKLNSSDINNFIANYANGNVQNGTYTPAPDLVSWPGSGDITKNEDSQLAPYVDVDGSNTYNPLTGGDYPLIKGDQALYFVYNDVTTSPHTSGGQTLGLEIRCMAYAYGTCSVVTANPALDYTTFYDYMIINRSTRTYSDFRIGLYSEADLGQYGDDYIGCDVKDNYGYLYNGDSDDETKSNSIGYGTNPPAAAFAMLRSPESTTDGIDNDGDGATDEAGEQMGMTNFSYFFTPIPGVPAGMQEPSVASEYYNYMHSIWKDGSPFSCHTPYAYGGTNSTPYIYPGTTYSNSACGSANWSESDTPNDRRYLMSTKQSSFQPGEIIRLEYAHVTSFTTSGSVLTKLDQDVNVVKAFYQSGTFNSCLATGIEEQSGASAFALYPNPASSQVTLTFEKALPADAMMTISDVLGKTVLTTRIGNLESIHIDLSAFTSGIYFVKVNAEGKSTARKFIRE